MYRYFLKLANYRMGKAGIPFFLFTLLFFLIRSGQYAFSQQKKNAIHLHGSIKHSSDTVLWVIPSAGIDKDEFQDSIKIDADGYFRFETNRVDRPITVNVTNYKNIQIPIFLAPGYDIHITGDGKDFKTLQSSIEYSGVGAYNNKYWKERYAAFSNKLNTSSLEKNEADFAAYQLSSPNIDSLVSAIRENIFGSRNTDPYKQYFRQAAITSVTLQKLHYALLYAQYNNYSFNQTSDFIKKYIDPKVLENVCDDSNLASNVYIELINNAYLNFLLSDPGARNASLRDDLENRINRIIHLFKGKTRDYVITQQLKKEIRTASGPEELESLKKYLDSISSNEIKSKINELYERRKERVSHLSAGSLVPQFSLPDTSGVIHHLQDFRGKVVLLEFWASWCGPCMEEIPFMKKFVDKYRSDSDIVIISIAVNDEKGKVSRHRIIKNKQMSWLQLEDRSGFMADNYKVDFFPRTVIIDKEGKMVASNAPLPRQMDELEYILKQALLK